MNVDIEKIVREYIDKSIHLSLGTSVDNKPWVCEVHFAYDENLNLYFISSQNSRHCVELTANPNVSGNIVKQHDLTESPNGIYFEGTATMIDVPTDSQLDLYSERLGRNRVGLVERVNDGEHKMYMIAVNNWYAFGKFDGEKNAKYELAWNGGAQ